MCKTISTMGMEHEEWLRLRKGGIGGSDAGAVCGLNLYRSPMAVYWERVIFGSIYLDSGRESRDFI